MLCNEVNSCGKMSVSFQQLTVTACLLDKFYALVFLRANLRGREIFYRVEGFFRGQLFETTGFTQFGLEIDIKTIFCIPMFSKQQFHLF